MALTSEVLFVNLAYLKRVTQLKGGVDENYVIPAIILAQDLHLQMLLGTALFERLKTDVSNGTLSRRYEDLLDTHVRKVTAWWTMVELLPNLYVQIDNAGLVQRTASNDTTASASDLRREVERARSNAQFYGKQMYRFLQTFAGEFAEYTETAPEGIMAQSSVYRQNGYSITGSSNVSRNAEIFTIKP